MYSKNRNRFWARNDNGMKFPCGVCSKNFPPSSSFNIIHTDCVQNLSNGIGKPIVFTEAIEILNEWPLSVVCTYCGKDMDPGHHVVLFHYACLSPFWDEFDKKKIEEEKNSIEVPIA